MKNENENKNQENTNTGERNLNLFSKNTHTELEYAQREALVQMTDRNIEKVFNEIARMPTLKVAWVDGETDQLRTVPPPASSATLKITFESPPGRPGPLEVGDWHRRAAIIHVLHSRCLPLENHAPYWVSGGSLVVPLIGPEGCWRFYRLDLPDGELGWNTMNAEAIPKEVPYGQFR